jgi:hypothetical protein
MKRIAFVMTTMLPTGIICAQTSQSQEPAGRVIAVVLGKEITVKEKENLNGLIVRALLEQFSQENKVEPSEEELGIFVQRMKEMKARREVDNEKMIGKLKKELGSAQLTERERKNKEELLQVLEKSEELNRELSGRNKGLSEEQHRAIDRSVAHHTVKAWKISKALYAKYGGRVIFQQAGLEPVDAYRDFLKEQERRGAFRILDKSFEQSFWRYFVNDAMHTFVPNEDAARSINTPWWLMEEKH